MGRERRAPRDRSASVGRRPDDGRRAAVAPDQAASAGPVAGEIVRLTISSMAYGGEALGRLADGTVVFVWGAMPGEEVEIEITERRRNFWRGQVRAVLTPSPDRVTPACSLFGICGGCQWQYMAYPAQVEAKQAILLEQVRGAYPQAAERLRPPVTMVDPWHYRNIAHFVGNEDGRPAFRRWQSHELVAIDECPVSQPPINAILPSFQGDLAAGERLSVRCSADGQLVQVWRGDSGVERVLVEQIGDLRYQISPRAFFQINTRQEARPATGQSQSLTEAMVQLVLEGVEGFCHQTIIDAYCGVGLFALPLARLAPRTIGIDEAGDSLRDAIQNAQAAGLTNALFLHGAADSLLPAIAEPVSAIVLDPPRTGVEERALQAIAGRGIPRIVYVSCNPATLGRDLQRLAATGYQLEWLRLIDLFPQTLHIEAVAVLTLR